MDEPRVGVVYNIPPEPPSEADTEWMPAGVLTIGVEYRHVDMEGLVEAYRDDPAQLRELLDETPEGGFQDEGVSLHVRGTADGHEYLRFDVFDGEPHYHYLPPPGPEVVNNVVHFDSCAHGDMLPFALRCLRERLPAMLRRAGGDHLADQLDPTVVGPVVDRVETLATRVVADVRRARAAASASAAASAPASRGASGS